MKNALSIILGVFSPHAKGSSRQQVSSPSCLPGKMGKSILPTLAICLGLAACKERSADQMPQPAKIEAEIAGSTPMVVTRNFPTPPAEGMKRMSDDLHLGRNAFAAAVSDAWMRMLETIEPGTPKNTLPVLFAKYFVFADGTTRLAVGQLQCGLEGDGVLSPNATFSCVLRTIDTSDPTKPVVIWTGRSALGTLQNSRIMRPAHERPTPGEVSLIQEESLGEQKVLRTILVFKPSKGRSVVMERHPSGNGHLQDEQVARPNNR